MHYPAILTREGKYYLAEFPDLPGCQTFAESRADLQREALDALTLRLRADLEDGDVPALPSRKVRVPEGGEVIGVAVPPQLGVAIAIRVARHDAHLTQSELARRMGVSQQQAAKLEQPDANPTVETLAKVAEALGLQVELAMVPVGR